MTFTNNRTLPWPPNFKRSEFVRAGVKVVPQHEGQLVALAWILQGLRDTVLEKRSITITNGYRDRGEFNRIKAGGWNPHPQSFHNSGLGADFVVAGLSPAQVQQRIRVAAPALAMGCAQTFTHLQPDSKGYREFAY